MNFFFSAVFSSLSTSFSSVYIRHLGDVLRLYVFVCACACAPFFLFHSSFSIVFGALSDERCVSVYMYVRFALRSPITWFSLLAYFLGMAAVDDSNHAY